MRLSATGARPPFTTTLARQTCVDMTHKKWVSEIKRLFKVAERSPDEAVQGLNQLVDRIESKRRVDTSEWHVAQTLGVIGAILSGQGRKRAAGVAFRRLAKHHQLEFIYHERAFVSALASEAIELIWIGQITKAARAVRLAERKSTLLSGHDKLLEIARRALATSKKGRSRASRAG
jgi:hypothetical protein